MAVSEKSLLDKIEKSSILEEIKKERENNGLAFDTTYSHKEDLENLLKLAEELKDKCDRAEEEIEEIKRKTITRILVTVLAAFIYSIGIFTFINHYPLDSSKVNSIYSLFYGAVSAFSLVSIFYPVYIISKKVRHLHKKTFSDRFALKEVLQLLRETSSLIAEQENWSVLSRAEFRIRLSRFNLEEKSESAFNFFS